MALLSASWTFRFRYNNQEIVFLLGVGLQNFGASEIQAAPLYLRGMGAREKLDHGLGLRSDVPPAAEICSLGISI